MVRVGLRCQAVRKLRGDSSAAALIKDAANAARRLKRDHRSYYERDPKAFREAVRKAHSRVFRLKPGPHGDPRIATAARERVRGVEWEQLYLKYIDFHGSMNEYICALAEAGFQRKVNAYLQKHPLLKRRWRRKTVASQHP